MKKKLRAASEKTPHDYKISKYSTFGSRIGLVGVAQTIASLKGLIILPILAKTLGAVDYGIWALILVTISLLQPLILFGLDNSILRFLSSKEKKEIIQGITTVSIVVILIGSIILISLFLSSDLIAEYIFEDESANVAIKIASFLIPISALNIVLLGSFRVFGQIKRYSLILLLQTFLEMGLIAFFVLSGYGLIGALVSVLITRIATIGVMAYLIISYAGLSQPDFSILRPYLRYGLPLIPALLFIFIVSSSDRYVIGFFMGAAPVGAYSAAYGIGAITLMFSSFIMYVLRPTVYDLFDKGKTEEVKVYLSYSLKYLMLLSIPSVFGLSVLAKPLLINLTTSEFVSVSSVFVVPLVASSILLYGIEQIFGSVIMLSKRTMIFAIVLAFAAMLNLGLNILLVPRWGIVAAAITTLIAYAVMAAIIYYKSRQYLKFELNFRFIVKSVLASIIMSLVIWILNPMSIMMILLSVVIGIIVYFAVLFLSKGIQKAETQFFLTFVKMLIKENIFRR